MKSPLPGGLVGKRYNRTLHGRSITRKEHVEGHNVILGYSTPGKGQALDVFDPPSTPVHAMHDGTVYNIKDRNGRLSYVHIVGENRVHSVYAHLYVRASLQTGMKVRAGELIGWIGRVLNDPHLHLELWMDGTAVSHSKPKCLACNIQELIDG